jgi:hypothetical protein
MRKNNCMLNGSVKDFVEMAGWHGRVRLHVVLHPSRKSVDQENYHLTSICYPNKKACPRYRSRLSYLAKQIPQYVGRSACQTCVGLLTRRAAP